MTNKEELTIIACDAARRWFYKAFEDELLEDMESAGLIAQAEGFSLSCIAELQVFIEEAITNG